MLSLQHCIKKNKNASKKCMFPHVLEIPLSSLVKKSQLLMFLKKCPPVFGGKTIDVDVLTKKMPSFIAVD